MRTQLTALFNNKEKVMGTGYNPFESEKTTPSFIYRDGNALSFVVTKSVDDLHKQIVGKDVVVSAVVIEIFLPDYLRGNIELEDLVVGFIQNQN